MEYSSCRKKYVPQSFRHRLKHHFNNSFCRRYVVGKEPLTGHTDCTVAVQPDTVFCLRIQRTHHKVHPVSVNDFTGKEGFVRLSHANGFFVKEDIDVESYKENDMRSFCDGSGL